MASPTWWTWIWVRSGSWWWTGRPGVLLSIWVAKSRTQQSDWTELIPQYKIIFKSPETSKSKILLNLKNTTAISISFKAIFWLISRRLAKRDWWVRRQPGRGGWEKPPAPGHPCRLSVAGLVEGWGSCREESTEATWFSGQGGAPEALLSCPSSLAYSTSHPGLGAGLAGSEVKRHSLWLQGVQGPVARRSAAGKGYLSACLGPQLIHPGVRAPPGLRITESSCCLPRWVTSLRAEFWDIKQNVVCSSKGINEAMWKQNDKHTEQILLGHQGFWIVWSPRRLLEMFRTSA